MDNTNSDNENTTIYYGNCEDCNKLGKLEKQAACSDSACHWVDCCIKFVCADNCNFYCNNGHLIEYKNDTGEVKNLKCNKCNLEIDIKYKWKGLSIKQHLKKYND